MAEPNNLSAGRVSEIFKDCMFKEGESTEGYILAEGIKVNFGFHPGRIKKHTDEILLMLKELPSEFMETGGGGWAFLNACNDKHGNQWTSFHEAMNQLFVIGIAAGKAKWQMPKEMWSAFPGGMPYVIVLDKENKNGN